MIASFYEKRETRNEKRETRNEKRETRNEKRETRNEKRDLWLSLNNVITRIGNRFGRTGRIRLIASVAGILIVAGAATLLLSTDTTAGWFDDAWQYRRGINFTHNSAIGSPRRVTITINTATPIAAGKMQDDCDDVRFTDINGLLLQFQLTGSCDNAATTFNVVFPTINNGTNPAYIYYGNMAAGSASQDVSRVTSLSPSGGAPSTAGEEVGLSPALYLSFNENYDSTAHDATTNANHGTITGALWQTDDMCVSSNCLWFDGSNDVVTVANAPSIDLSSGLADGFTIQGWIRPNSLGEGSLGQIFNKGTNTYIRLGSGSSAHLADLVVSLGLSSSHATVTVSDGITLNRWHHVSVTYTNDGDDEITVYVDGIAQGTSTNGAGNPVEGDVPALIGGPTTANFHGFIDEFKIYPYERTADQIKTDFIRGTSASGSTASFGHDNMLLSHGLAGYWKLDEANGNIADGSGNATTLTNVNTTAFVGGKFGNAGNFVRASSRYFANIPTTPPPIASDQTDNSNLSWGETSKSITFGSPPNDGDIIYLFYVRDSGSPEARTWPTGFTEIIHGSDSSDTYMSVAWKRASNEASGTYTLSLGGSDDQNQQLLGVTYTGAIATGDPHETIGTIQTQCCSSSVTVNSITTQIDNAAHIIFVGASDSLGSTAATGYTLDGYGDTSMSARVAMLSRIVPSAGATGNISVTGTASSAFVNIYTSLSLKQQPPSTPDVATQITSDLTLSAWINPSSNSASTQYSIAGKWDAGEEGYLLAQYGDEIRVYINSGSVYAETTSANLATGTWHHVTGVYDAQNQTIKIFVNGIEQAVTITGTVPSSITNTDGRFHIGAANSATTADNFYDGLIDEVRIYNQRFTPAEVEKLYHWAPGPVGYWKLDENTGTVAYDTSTNSNHAFFAEINENFITSVEYVEIELAGTTASGSAPLTKGQIVANSVPFMTAMVDNNSDFFRDILVNVRFDSAEVIIERSVETTGSDINVGIYVVEFDPTKVRVQQGTVGWSSGNTGGTAAISSVDQSKAAMVFYFRTSTGTDDWFNSSIAGWFSSNTQVSFQRNGTGGTVSLNWYVFEALNDEFSVQANSFSIANGSSSNTATLGTSVDMDRSFVIGSYRTPVPNGDQAHGSISIYLDSSTTVGAARSGTGSGNAITDIRTFVVTFSGNELVQRGTFSYANGVSQ